MPQNSNFRLPHSCRYGAKSCWRPPRVNLGAKGVPLGPKIGQNHKKNTMPQNSHFPLPRAHQFFAKNINLGYGAKSRWGPFKIDLGANGVSFGKKMAQNRKRLPWPKSRIFDYPVLIDFSSKMEVADMATNHGGEPLGSILGPMGSHWVQKWIKTVKNTMPQNSYFRLPRGHRFFAKNGSYGYGAKSRWGHPRVYLWGNGVPLGPRNGSKL